MNHTEAKKKYSKHWKAMQEYLNGITLSQNEDGSWDIPQRDLDRAYNIVTAKRNGVIWD